MTDFMNEIFEPKLTKEVQLKVVTKAGHIVTNPKSKKNWTIKIDDGRNELKVISFK